uniref:ATP-dependent DNA helicase n=1 Tax=Aegilops tauschii subsp. strangulata TaxID=200361 RepID=A0A453C8I9_AEGTS
MGGDFRQILPVIPKGKREHIISASIKRSYLWKNFEEYRLTENMRLNSSEGSPEEKAKTAEFANWILEERAILCPRNETVDQINTYIMSQIHWWQSLHPTNYYVTK